MCERWRCAIKAARIFYSARQKNQATPRLLLSCLSQYPLNPASVILPSLSLTPSVPLTFPSHSSHLLSYFSFLSVMGFGAVEDWGGMLCVCLWWVVRAVHRRSSQAESNCRCCGAKVIRRATRSRWGKIEQASPVRSASTQSSCQLALFTCYTIIIRPRGTLWNNTTILWRTRRGHGEGVMVEYHRGKSLTESCCVLAAGSKLDIQKSVRGSDMLQQRRAKLWGWKNKGRFTQKLFLYSTTLF